MARPVIKVNLELDRIFVHDEGDGWGDAEPYLWSVFFKVDGDSIVVTDALTLSGAPTIHTTPGSHGNLGTTDADEGDNITIPSAIGEWESFLKPIPTPASLSSLVEDVGGVIGVVAVLMEEDNVSDAGANAGHQALNEAVRNAIQQIVNTRSLTNQDITDEEIAGFEGQIATAVENAIKNQQNFFENLWSWLNPDDTIGTKVFIFKQDDLDPSTAINFSHRWNNEGDWQIFGHITSTVLCAANSLNNFFSASSVRKSASASKSASFARKEPDTAYERIHYVEQADCEKEVYDLTPLREFRDGDYQKAPGLANWMRVIEQHNARLIYLLATNKDLHAPAKSLLKWAPKMIQKRDGNIPDEQLDCAEKVLTALYTSKSRRARIDASRMLDVIPLLRGKTVNEGMQLLSQLQPARHPYSGGNPCLRIQSTAKKVVPEEATKEEAALEYASNGH